VNRLTYWVGAALSNIRLNQTSTLIAVLTTAFTLACFGVFLLVYFNLKAVANLLQEDFQVVVYLEDDLSQQEIRELQRQIDEAPAVEALVYVSKDQALEEFRKQFPSDSHLLQGLGENPLPASFEVVLVPALRSAKSVKRWAGGIRDIPGVADVQYSREWLERLSAVIRYLELAALTVGSILSIASVAIIGSTIRLTLQARQDEIEIMELIGATGTFIKVPYLLEGAILGTLGSILSLVVLRGGFELMKAQVGSPGHFLDLGIGAHFFTLYLSSVLVGAGLLLGFTGSFVSLLDIGRAKT
jgi:cell division transport system permease protein